MRNRTWGCLLLAVALIFAVMPAAGAQAPDASTQAAGFKTGVRGVGVGGAFYCVEKDGIYRLQGEDRKRVIKGRYDRKRTIVTDGETFYVTRTDSSGTALLRVRDGKEAKLTKFNDSFNKIAGVIGGTIFLLFIDPEDEMAGNALVSMNLETGEESLLLKNIYDAQVWGKSMIVDGFRTDACPVAYRTVDEAGNTATISETALLAAGVGDAVYYWNCDVDVSEYMTWDRMKLVRIGAEGAETLATIDCPEESAWPVDLMDGFATYISFGDERQEYVVDYGTGAVSRVELPGNMVPDQWFQDGGNTYCFVMENSMLYAAGSNGYEELVELPDAMILGIFDGYIYYTDWEGNDKVMAVRAETEA